MIVLGVPCRCAERRAALASAFAAVETGDAASAAKLAAGAVASFAVDARRVADAARLAARARLAR